MVSGTSGQRGADTGCIGVLLAGGESRRMGVEKPLQKVHGSTLIESVLRAVSPCVGESVIVTNHPALYAFLGVRMIPDLRPGLGPLAGIHAGLSHITKRGLTSPALVVAADYPFLEPGALRRILETAPEKDVVLPRIEGRLHPLCARYALTTVAAVEQSLAQGGLSVHALIERLDAGIIAQDQIGGVDAARIFFNVNTPEDLERAEGMSAQTHSRE